MKLTNTYQRVTTHAHQMSQNGYFGGIYRPFGLHMPEKVKISRCTSPKCFLLCRRATTIATNIVSEFKGALALFQRLLSSFSKLHLMKLHVWYWVILKSGDFLRCHFGYSGVLKPVAIGSNVFFLMVRPYLMRTACPVTCNPSLEASRDTHI